MAEKRLQPLALIALDDRAAPLKLESSVSGHALYRVA